ncbi:MAG: hypothetical protein IT448_00490 [Phycisphaerales bacterium]|nr:hypothetical protein [Phycisphaerales bacterium]
MTHRNQHRPTAFTLAEILTVVVIIGIASAIVIPQISNRNDLRLASATRVVMADLMYAQNLSIARQTPYFVYFAASSTPQILGIYDDPSLADPIVHPVQKSPYSRTFNGDKDLDIPGVSINSVTIKAGSKTGNALGFSSLGEPLLLDSTGTTTALSEAAKVTLISGTLKQTIVVQPLTAEISITTP